MFISLIFYEIMRVRPCFASLDALIYSCVKVGNKCEIEMISMSRA